MSGAVLAQPNAQLLAAAEDGYARLVLSFPDRLDLPKHSLRYENSVLAVEFDERVDLLLPDLAVALPDYVAVARVDPNGKGVRFGLRRAFNVNRIEAGERLFIDLLPMSWQGLPPSLPDAVIAELAERAKRAAELAHQQQKAEEAKSLRPKATLRVGRHPTFIRAQFDWSVDTEAEFRLEEGEARLVFDWPVPVDLYALAADLPAELLATENVVEADGSHVVFALADGVEPRFYATSSRQFIVDIDIEHGAGLAAAIAAEEVRLQDLLLATADAATGEATSAAAETGPGAEAGGDGVPSHGGTVTPKVSVVGATVRVAFPFEHDTAAAVFRRGDTLWMLFDTGATITLPAPSEALDSIATGVAVIPAGDTKVVRLDLANDRLATLGSEGRSWVLSLGDVLLNPTEPLPFSRERDRHGLYQMTADLQRPAKVHQFRDPVVGDLLNVVTAFPPARGVVRRLEYVDFVALRSVHGLVVQPRNDSLEIDIVGEQARIQAAGGLSLSAVQSVRQLDGGNAPNFRASYVDLASAREANPATFALRRKALLARAAETEGRVRDIARLNLAHFYLANQLAHEAIGVLGVLQAELANEELAKQIRLSRGIADTLAARPNEALKILSAGSFPEESDALMWRAIARTDAGDYHGARMDALMAESVVGSYPNWVANRFLLAGARAAVEADDLEMAHRYLDLIVFAQLDPEQVTRHHLLQGRVAEAENRPGEALEVYGEVIAAEIRPTRAEAVYRTLLLLDKTGRIEPAKAAENLAAEVLMWRGDLLEAEMQKLLAELQFRNKDYRRGFETVKQVASTHPDSPTVGELLDVAQTVFSDLYLNGRADELEEVEALSLYYDFRQLTPPGSRGDEMIRNLVRRLVKVDLLAQAGDLLEYQIDSRLKGVGQAQIAADLAVIRIADRDPEGALRVLNRTRLADISPALERQRRILEARALIDAGREYLAVDLLARVQGRDADLLRVDGYWQAKNYAVAAELLEGLHSAGNAEEPLTQADRMGVVKAAVGFVLAGDKLGLSRLRSKFGDRMARSAEWAVFDFVTGSAAPTSAEFRAVAREVSGLDSLNAFLASYRAMYEGEEAVVPDTVASGSA